MDKDNILRLIIENAAANGGVPLGKERFYSITGIKESDWSGKYWVKWSDAIVEAGYSPNKMTESYDDLYLLDKYSEFISELKHIPTNPELRMKKRNDPGFPSPNTFGRFGKKTELLQKTIIHCTLEKRYLDIIPIIQKELDETENKKNEESKDFNNVIIDNYKQYIPPILDKFLISSVDEKMALQFEKMVNLCFSILGYEVDDLGQGTGRNPDGIAKLKKEHYAIILDAKTRKEKYTIGTEDRKFIEYINKYSRELRLNGYESIYLVIISNDFSVGNEGSFKRIQKETNVITSFCSAEMLLKLVACRIKAPSKLEYLSIKDILSDGNKIDKYIEKYYDQIFR